MAETVTMPKLGFDMAEGTLVRWVIKEGEPVTKGDVLAEIETDKATVEVQSSAEGIVYRHLVPAGEVVPVGNPIAVVAAPGEQVDESQLTGNKPEQTPQPEPEKQEVASVEQKQPAASVEQKQPAAAPVVVDAEMLRISPIARRMIMENNLSLEGVIGSGPGGRIVKKDIEKLLQRRREPVAAPAEFYKPAVPAFTPGIIPADEMIEVNRLRAAIGRRMVESHNEIPHFYVTHEYNVASLLDIRKQVNAVLPEEEKVSVNDFVIKATALALRQYPGLNAVLKEEKIIRKGHVNIGVAVAVEGGLLTVVVKDADQKPLRLISKEVKEMVARVRFGKVRPEDIEGSTFSISNLGMFDVEHFIAIINPPEAAILAVGSAREMPVVKDGIVQVGTRMRATLSADHRITDGAEAAQFLQALARWIENPAGMLM
jgi:pyruvate dehydrogenase E2 component (dihydrolipoamide acetyltransferase)